MITSLFMTSCAKVARRRHPACALRIAFVIAGLTSALGAAADAPDTVLVPNANLHVRGIPAIPAAIARKIAPYDTRWKGGLRRLASP